MHYMRYNLCLLDTKVLSIYTFMTIYLPVHHYPNYIRYKCRLPAFYLYKVFQKSKTAQFVSDVPSSTTLPPHAFSGWNTQARYIFITKNLWLQDNMHYMRYNLSFPDTMILRTYTFVTIYLPVHHYPHYIRYRKDFQHFTFINSSKRKNCTFCITDTKQ